ncbi:MAG: DoxX family protein [Phycisphaerales bacterium]
MQQRVLRIVGWVITVLASLLLLLSATMKFSAPPMVTEQFVDRFGYPAPALLWIAVTEVACVILLLIPQTAILGAILLTGYLGGAVATHVRVSDPFITPIVLGVLVWAALVLREPRLRAILPLRFAQKV